MICYRKYDLKYKLNYVQSINEIIYEYLDLFVKGLLLDKIL